MSTKKSLARISCTIPEDVLAAADRVAAREQRSRSWVISEAVRQFAVEVIPGPKAVREPAGPVYQTAPPGLGSFRLAQLVADLQLTPEQRVIAAEETAAVSRVLRPSRGPRLVQFDRFEDYLDWKRREAAGG
jgi:hypothetical protein